MRVRVGGLRATHAVPPAPARSAHTPAAAARGISARRAERGDEDHGARAAHASSRART